MSKLCQDCGSRCCKYFCFQLDTPTTFEEFENIRWFLMHEGVTIHIDVEGDWYIGITNRCASLMENGLCRDYDNRPMICRSYDTDNCDRTQGDYEYQALFRKPEEVENYARSRFGKRYEQIKAKAYEKLAAKTKAATGEKPKSKGAAKSSRQSKSKKGQSLLAAKIMPKGNPKEELSDLFA